MYAVTPYAFNIKTLSKHDSKAANNAPPQSLAEFQINKNLSVLKGYVDEEIYDLAFPQVTELTKLCANYGGRKGGTSLILLVIKTLEKLANDLTVNKENLQDSSKEDFVSVVSEIVGHLNVLVDVFHPDAQPRR
jgi:hypothetical protein